MIIKTGIALALLPVLAFAGGCVTPEPKTGRPQYICIDGRMLTCQNEGVVWQYRRGCFPSVEPCKVYQAMQYGRYSNQKNLIDGQMQCRLDYPFMLGEMQTH
ncbi:hypothetical protein ACFORL_03475 [Legionella dresdenensis]|uniref:Hemolysin n=1 Tax=Legionella dresdenensis TaxID=450200 RepID=A0ABV8CDT1_9GAMM